jgi:sugar O-acyltransferase (sialic acid O-acetyltransferase NeuD family)
MSNDSSHMQPVWGPDGVRDVVFWGATGHAKVLRECLNPTGLKLVALFDNNPKTLPPFSDVPLYFGQAGWLDWLERKSPASSVPVGFLAAIGGQRGRDRVAIQAQAVTAGLQPLTAIHRTAFVAEDARIGAGSQILARATVCVEVVMGEACIVNTGASVDHECRLGKGVHLAPGAVLAGCVDVGDYATVYTGAVVAPRVRIGEGAIVGAGAVVLRDVPPNTLVVGNPARRVREIENGSNC